MFGWRPSLLGYFYSQFISQTAAARISESKLDTLYLTFWKQTDALLQLELKLHFDDVFPVGSSNKVAV